jgi:hypothetical protein
VLAAKSSLLVIPQECPECDGASEHLEAC